MYRQAFPPYPQDITYPIINSILQSDVKKMQDSGDVLEAVLESDLFPEQFGLSEGGICRCLGTLVSDLFVITQGTDWASLCF